MKKVVVSIQNGLLAEAMTNMLHLNGAFQPHRIRTGQAQTIIQDCIITKADILLMEVSYAEDTSIEARIQEGTAVRDKLPDCKVVLLCDENSTPDIARDIQQAKKDGIIDGFFYTSVSSSYLLAALDAL